MIIFKEYLANLNEVEFGTCELCWSTGLANEDVFLFEDTETGEKRFVENFYWDWGDCHENIYPIDNLIRFAGFIREKNITDMRWFDFDKLYSEYKEKYEPN